MPLPNIDRDWDIPNVGEITTAAVLAGAWEMKPGALGKKSDLLNLETYQLIAWNEL